MGWAQAFPFEDGDLGFLFRCPFFYRDFYLDLHAWVSETGNDHCCCGTASAKSAT